MNRQYGALNGVAIFLIVLNHAIFFGLQVSPVEGAGFQLLGALQALGAFAVPMFLFVSGAFLAYAAREFSVAFVQSSLARVLWPYVIWSGVFYALIYFASGVQYSAMGYVRNLLIGYPYHFIPLLVFWYLVTPVFIPLARRRPVAFLAAVAALQVWLVAIRFPEVFGLLDAELPAWVVYTRPPILYRPMSDWGVYFPLGLVMSLHAPALKPRLERWWTLALAATAVLFVLGLLHGFKVVVVPWARMATPVPLMVLLPLIDRRSIPRFEFFEQLGRRSYGIYVTHFVVLNLLMLAVGSVSRNVSPLLVYPGFLIAGLAVSWILMEAMGRVNAFRRVYRYVFGIVPPPSAGAGSQRSRSRVQGSARQAVNS